MKYSKKILISSCLFGHNVKYDGKNNDITTNSFIQKLIENNLLIGNKYGVSVKDSSFCEIINTSFINNKIGIDTQLKNNWKQYKRGGTISAKNCLFYQNSKNTKKGKES